MASLTRSQVICYHWSSITFGQSTHIRQTQIGTCCVALGSGSPSAGSRYMLFMVGVSAHDSEAKDRHPGLSSLLEYLSLLTVIHFSSFLRARACGGGGGGA